MISVTLRQFILNALYHDGYLQLDAGLSIPKSMLDDIQRAVRHEPLEGEPPPAPGHWEVVPLPPGVTMTAPFFGPTDPDTMSRADWQAFQQKVGLRDRPDIFTRIASTHPEGQKLGDNSITLDFDAYVAGGGTFAPWLVKV